MIHRASALGSCLTGQIAVALGMKPIAHTDAQLLVMAQGQLHEDDVITTLTADGYTVKDQQLPIFLHVNPPVVEGHLDGIITETGVTQSRVLEIKSMGDSSFKAFKAKGWEAGGLIDRYKWQISVYMHATGLEAFVIAKSRNTGELLRHGVEMPFYSLTEIADRVAYIENHVARGVLPDDCSHDWFCNYKYLCSTPGEEEGAKRSPSDEPWLDDAQITAAAARYVQLAARIKAMLAPVAAELKALEAEQAEVKDLLKSALPGLVEPNRPYRAGDCVVTWVESEVAASTRKYASVKPVKKEQS